MPTDDARWLAELHERWTSPDHVVDDTVRRASGSAAAARERIVGGEGNEVWAVTTSSGDDLVVRISHSTTFAGERWAAEQSRRAGVPVPEILLVDDRVAPGVAIWVHRRVPGEPLGSLPAGEAELRLTEEAGEILARIHSVGAMGNGRIDERGRASFERFGDFLGWDDGAADAALANGIARTDLDEAAAIVDACDGWADPPHLLHGDWLAEHVLVRDGRVVAIIDFGGAANGDAAYDIAYWRFFRAAEEHTMDAVIRGYRRARDPGPSLDLRVHVCLLSKSIHHMRLYTSLGRDVPARLCRERFDEALAWLRARA